MTDPLLNTLSDKILEIIRRKPGHIYDIAALARRLRVNPADILFGIDLLTGSGYHIKLEKPNKCIFDSAPDLLLEAEIKNDLKTKFIGQVVYSYSTVQSTNAIAARLAEAGAREGTLVIAEGQSQGRGRLGRVWHSPPGLGVYLSLILYPDIDPATAPGLSIVAAIALADAFKSIDGLEPKIKWPNDCLLGKRKAAGILTELAGEPGRVHYVIVGVGININHRRSDFPEELWRMATSVRRELQQSIKRVSLTQRFLTCFEKDYIIFRKSGLARMRRRIIGYSSLLGKAVKLEQKGNLIQGVAVDIDDRGQLILEDGDKRFPVNAGEVTVVKK